jgi:uncharacterized membrane protein
MNDMGMQGGGQGQAVDPQDAANNKVMAVLSYWGVLWLAPFFMAKQSPFVKYHLNQGIVVFAIYVVGSILATVLGMISSMLAMVGSLVYLVGFVFAVLGSLNAWNGKAAPLPVLCAMAPQLIK